MKQEIIRKNIVEDFWEHSVIASPGTPQYWAQGVTSNETLKIINLPTSLPQYDEDGYLNSYDSVNYSTHTFKLISAKIPTHKLVNTIKQPTEVSKDYNKLITKQQQSTQVKNINLDNKIVNYSIIDTPLTT